MSNTVKFRVDKTCLCREIIHNKFTFHYFDIKTPLQCYKQVFVLYHCIEGLAEKNWLITVITL